MDVKKFGLPAEGKLSEVLISVALKSGGELDAGTAFLPKGTRVPAAGVNAYPKHEISFVLEGLIVGEVNGIPCRFEAGDIIHMDPFETQWGDVLEDTRIFYVYFGDKVESEGEVKTPLKPA